jgi:hypothetical protein
MPVVGMLFIFGLALLAGAVTFALEKLVPAKKRAEHNDVIGFVYAVIGVSYAVLLGLVVIAAWNTQVAARDNTYTEGNALSRLAWYAYSLPPSEHTEIEDLLTQYTYEVITVEWADMAHQQFSPEAWSTYQELHKVIAARRPAAPSDVAQYQIAVDAADHLGAARRERLAQSTESIPPLLWATLIMGGVITVGFAFLFGMKSTGAHALIMFSLALLIGGLLLVINELVNPFSGAVKVGSVALQLALQRIQELS